VPRTDSLSANVTSYDYSLPLQIGSNISVKEYNTFLNRNENTGYKFNWERGEVFIVEMTKAVREAAVSYIQDCFKEPNNGVKVGPIEVLNQPCKRFFLLICLLFDLE
jgi:hypothetical protein